MKIKKGDQVLVTTGNDKSSTPRKVTGVVDGGRKLVVQGVNVVQKHVKRGHPKSPQGGRLAVEMPIDASNAVYYCDSCGKGGRLGYRYTDEGAKERFCKKCGTSAGAVSPAKAKYAKS